MLKKTLSLLLALALLSGPAAGAVKWEFPASAHTAVHYDDMLPVTGFDETDLLAALKELEGVCSRHSRDRDAKETRRRVQGPYPPGLWGTDPLATQADT